MIQVGAAFGGPATVIVPAVSGPVAWSGTEPTWPTIATPGLVLAVLLPLLLGLAADPVLLLLVQAEIPTTSRAATPAATTCDRCLFRNINCTPGLCW
jgi:hypothetical protein